MAGNLLLLCRIKKRDIMSRKQKLQAVKQEQKEKVDNTDNKEDKQSAQAKQDQQQTEKVKDQEQPAEESTVDKVSEKEEDLLEKLAEMKDKYIRLSAEFDNYRKRTLKEKMDITKYASEDVLVKILPLVDDFERAIKANESSSDEEAIKQGISLIYNKLVEFLTHSGVQEIKAIDCTFDVDVHDAVAKIPVEDKDKKGKIVDVIQKGYFLQDKVIRHSKVVVGE